LGEICWNINESICEFRDSALVCLGSNLKRLVQRLRASQDAGTLKAAAAYRVEIKAAGPAGSNGGQAHPGQHQSDGWRICLGSLRACPRSADNAHVQGSR